MTPILITGSNGLLGQNLLFTAPASMELLATDIQEASLQTKVNVNYHNLDITRYDAVRELMLHYHPGYVINAAAYTNVDGAETEKEQCWRVNVTGVENLARAARLAKSKIIHVSTDYLFDGKNGPYDENARPNPLGYYAKSKLAAENALIAIEAPHAVVRTMVLYGAAQGVKANFAVWLANSLQQGKPVRIVDDQIGTTTLAGELAQALWRIIELDKMDIYNISSPDLLSRYQFALNLAKTFGFDSSGITPIKTRDLQQPAPRPLKSGLIVEKARKELGIELLPSQQALKLFKQQYKEFYDNNT